MDMTLLDLNHAILSSIKVWWLFAFILGLMLLIGVYSYIDEWWFNIKYKIREK
jgi:phosphate/sulfate permease